MNCTHHKNDPTDAGSQKFKAALACKSSGYRPLTKPPACSKNIHLSTQSGVGLIEVMLAVFLLAFGALAAGRVNTVALTSARTAEVHSSVSNLGHEILEILKADPESAANGGYNVQFLQQTPTNAPSDLVNNLVAEWKARVGSELPDGTGSIDCDITACTVSLSWREHLIPGQDRMSYNLRTSL